MTRLDEMKIWILESSLGENEKEGLLYLIEKKTREEYRKRQIKNHYNMKLNETTGKGYMLVDSMKYKIRPQSKDNNNPASASLINGKIHIDINKLAKIKGAKNRDAIIQHEIGHTKLHGWNIKKNKVDRTKTNSNIMYSNIRTSVESRYPNVRQIPDDIRYEMGKAVKRINKIGSNHENSKLTEKRSNFRKQASHLADKTGHTNLLEFEADQYAANRVGLKHLKRGLRQVYKQQRKIEEKDRDRIRGKLCGKQKDDDVDFSSYTAKDIAIGKKIMDSSKRAMNSEEDRDMKNRFKALGDKTIKRSSRDVF